MKYIYPVIQYYIIHDELKMCTLYIYPVIQLFLAHDITDIL